MKSHYDSGYVMDALNYIAGNYRKQDLTISAMAKHIGISGEINRGESLAAVDLF